ncbi:MAG: hypothetical protein J6X18_12260 [Bacteroidales bacterium]|nr:hypothetical protein [Bacteroidales bacterium]
MDEILKKMELGQLIFTVAIGLLVAIIGLEPCSFVSLLIGIVIITFGIDNFRKGKKLLKK